MAQQRPDTYRRGLGAESLAALILRLKGYRIVAMRYKTPVGEIDMVASRGKLVVFVEVKARQSLNDALSAVTPRMKNRVTRAAAVFLMNNPAYSGHDMRFDLFAVRSPFRWQHLDNAWRPRA